MSHPIPRGFNKSHYGTDHISFTIESTLTQFNFAAQELFHHLMKYFIMHGFLNTLSGHQQNKKCIADKHNSIN